MGVNLLISLTGIAFPASVSITQQSGRLMTGCVYVRVTYSFVAEQSLRRTEEYFQGGQMAGHTLWLLSSVAQSVIYPQLRHITPVPQDIIQRGSEDRSSVWYYLFGKL